MKSNTLITLLAIAVLATSGAVGCRKKPSRLTNIPGQEGVVGDTSPNRPKLGDASVLTTPDPNSGRMTTDLGPKTGEGIPPVGADKFFGWNENATIFAADTVYFDFDRSTIKPSELPKIRRVADSMKATPGNALRVEGHTDNRGTEEYNRALGERRALSVREELVRQGVNPEMVVTISYGEDRPADPENNDAAWAKNRRADFIQLSPPVK